MKTIDGFYEFYKNKTSKILVLEFSRPHSITDCWLSCTQRTGPGDVAVFENRQSVTAAKFINKSSLFILLTGDIRWLELKPNSE